MSEADKEQFIDAVENWVCDPYTVVIQYIAQRIDGAISIRGASIDLFPLPFPKDLSFSLDSGEILAGHILLHGQSREAIFRIIENAVNGKLEIGVGAISLKNEGAFSYYSEHLYGDKWFSGLHLQVSGNQSALAQLPYQNVARIEAQLRRSSPPFDGLQDLSTWLSLNNPLQTNQPPSITIRVGTPVDIILPESRLDQDELSLVLHAHPQFDLGKYEVAINTMPGDGVHGRFLASSRIKWKKKVSKGKREGKARIKLKNADSAFMMLTIGEITVRRHWLPDPKKASNSRLVSTQLFDNDLKQVRNALFDSQDPNRFEKGVGALFFLMGFSPGMQVESDAPDIIAATPSGRLVVVECTMRIADFSSKLGKLVDRKNALLKELQGSRIPNRVEGILVCRLPKSQIAINVSELKSHQIILLTEEDLQHAITMLREHLDLDKYIDDTLSQLNAQFPLTSV